MDDVAEPVRGDLTVYLFPDCPERDGFHLFNEELENNSMIAFHGTAEGNLQSIIEKGFRIEGELQSCSFAKNSPLALRYAREKRSEASPNGCVVVVRFGSLDEVTEESSIFYVYKLKAMPEVVGYCIVPACYRHI